MCGNRTVRSMDLETCARVAVSREENMSLFSCKPPPACSPGTLFRRTASSCAWKRRSLNNLFSAHILSEYAVISLIFFLLSAQADALLARSLPRRMRHKSARNSPTTREASTRCRQPHMYCTQREAPADEKPAR